jgi:hypothetical protein
MSPSPSHENSDETNVTYAYMPDPSLKELIGKCTLLADIFTSEKIAACQKLINDARNSFFNSAVADMHVIKSASQKHHSVGDYKSLCRILYQPVCNIKGQAEAFGFSMIGRVCKYLIEYCEGKHFGNGTVAKDMFIMTKLVEALERAFEEKIVDSGGAIERELIAIVELARK